MNTNRIVARWETRGADWLELTSENTTMEGPEGALFEYSYKGNACGGCFWAASDTAAIARMEAPWGDPRGAGAATVLKSDRPSLRRTTEPLNH